LQFPGLGEAAIVQAGFFFHQKIVYFGNQLEQFNRVLFRGSKFSVQRERRTSRAAEHRLDEPSGLSLSMVASLQCPLPFHAAS
jgi:hypothetical protein